MINSETAITDKLTNAPRSSKVEIARYDFLSPELVQDIRQLDGYPDRRPGFRSSVAGLHFIGATAARTFGPPLYFVTGTEFASLALTSHISKNRLAIA
jgi:hypothetical protein